MLPKVEKKYTLEEYLELDHKTEEKLEFWDGKVWVIEKSYLKFATIKGNIIYAIGKKKHSKDKTIEIFPNLRVKVPAYPPYRYPDISALYGDIEIENLGKQELLVNPQLIIEILSDSTADFDQGDKFTYYKSIESFTEYVLIAQHRPHVTQFIKESENSWRQHEFNDLNDTFNLASLDCELNLTEIYENVEFPERSTRFDLISVRNDER